MFEPEVEKENKQKEQMQMLLIVGIIGIGYYLFFFLPEQRNETKKEIKGFLQEVPVISPSDLDSKIWEGKKSWEEYLDKLYLPSQISNFAQKIEEAINEKREELQKEERERPIRDLKEARKQAINDIKNACKKEELDLPIIKKSIKKFNKRINNSPLEEIDKIADEAKEFIKEERFKRQGLHWRRKSHNWADRWLKDSKQSFEQAWAKMTEIMMTEPEHFNISSSYKIYFPPSLWNDLTEEEKKHKKTNELTLKDEVKDYKFNDIIDKWYRETAKDPIRGMRTRTKLDNNAILYGAPRTGKSIIVEKLAYETDKYPLIVIQGSQLTPKDLDYKAGIDPLLKFLFTLCDINWTLVDDFNFKREEDGEVRYILFIDEANQITTSTVIPTPTRLTFLKECMGRDDQSKESQNLWIAATNHLDQINEAVYQPGRLSNQLCFSWTLGDFMRYSEEESITRQFPQHWLETKVLKEEDNKWVNRFNKIHFDRDFLGKDEDGITDNNRSFWYKFINHGETQKKLNEVKKEDATEDNPEQPGIQWGEFFEFFWKLFDSKQLENFDGKFTTPREPKIEKVVEKNLILASNQISQSIDTRLKEIFEEMKKIRGEMEDAKIEYTTSIDDGIDQLRNILAEIGSKI